MSRILFVFLRWCPGALGILLRQKLYPRFFRHCGKNVLFGRFIDITNPHMVTIGNGVVLSNDTVLYAQGVNKTDMSITIEDNVFIGTGTKLHAASEKILLKSGANVSSNCLVNATSCPVIIGSDCLLAAYCVLGKHSGSSSCQVMNKEGEEKSMTRVGDRCWLGARTTVYAGINIGHDCVVGAHADVCKTLPPLSVCIGKPASVLRFRT